MALVEINFDGIVGPSHNYAGLSLGNLAATSHAGEVSRPREAALQGLAKMRHNMALGLVQGFFVPLDRPNMSWLENLGTSISSAEPHIRAAAFSASSMWTANAATVSPAPDCRGGLCHLSPANLMTMPHRSHEWPGTLAQLQLAFANRDHFAIHSAVLPPFGDEGAANHMRMCRSHGEAGLEIFVYGTSGDSFPARQHIEASKAIARRHQLDPSRVLFVEQSPEAIAAGAFHNDVVAVANEQVLLCHEQAFADPDGTYAAIRERMPEAEIIVVPASAVSLADAVQSYLFNAQLVTLPGGAMALIVPLEACEHARVRGWIDALLAGNGPIRQVLPVDLRQSMANGGGPACLRLRVVADPAAVDPRFQLDEARADRIAATIERHWPEAIEPGELGNARLTSDIIAARLALLEALELAELG